jgi:Zn-dependent peptidase ImmA (M78 family)
MAGEQIPVTPALITWARKRAGYSIEEAAEKFKKIAAWEASDSYPTYSQLEELANTFKVPVAVFFFPAPPPDPPIEETFRTLSEAQLGELEPRLKLLLRKAKALQIALAELNGGRNPAPRSITKDLTFAAAIPAETMATAVRDYLGVSVEEQSRWPNVEVALEQWRQRFADAGVYVFKDQFRDPAFAGFCLTDDEFPIIYVNNTSAKARQIFTLFHELAHLLFHTSGIDTENDAYIERLAGDPRRIEVLCNRFAGVFLVPQEALAAALSGRNLDPETVQEIARRFNVSQLVIYRRLLDIHRIDQTTYAAAHRRAQEGPPPKSSGGDYYNNQLAYLGRPFVEMALRQYRGQRITEEQLADYLNVKPKNLTTLEERFLRGAAA